MYANVLSFSLYERLRSTVLTSLALGGFLVLGMWAYGSIGTDFYQSLPEAMLEITGIPANGDAAALAYNVILGTIASLTLAGLAVSMGAASIAGEEREGTLGLLLSNPRSRTAILGAKATAALVLTALGGLVLWAGAALAPVLLDVTIGDTQIGAMTLHLTVNAIFWGSLALAVGAWTGNRAAASGVAAAAIAMSFLAVGIIPLFDGIAWLAKIIPWYWFDGSEPLVNGVNWAHLALLGSGVVTLTGVAVLGVRRRDLVRQHGGTNLADRLRNHATIARAMNLLGGGGAIGRIWVRALSRSQGVILLVSAIMFAMMGVMMGPIYAALEDQLASLADLPEAMLAFFGASDMSTPAGWYQGETFALMAPAAIIFVVTLMGARALAGEEHDRTMGLLLANPVSRTTVVLHNALAVAVAVLGVSFATFVGVAIGRALGGLDLPLGNIAAVSVHLAAFGLFFGGVALTIGAATGKTRTATFGTIAAAMAGYVIDVFLGLTEGLANWARVSPFYWYASSEPLTNGPNLAHVTVLVASAAVLVAAAVALFARRDLVRD